MPTLKHFIRLLLITTLSLGVILTTALGGIMNPASAQEIINLPSFWFTAHLRSLPVGTVLTRLIAKNYPVVAVANLLRGVKNDADYVATALKNIEGPIVLVGHSYSSSAITNAVHDNTDVNALVYVAAFAPDTGETAAELSGRYRGSMLGSALAPPVTLPDGDKDLYIQQDKFYDQFAADVPIAETKLMASTQRLITEAALNEGSGVAAWKSIPSWFIYGDRALNIPAAVNAFMADRANSRETIAVAGASHVVMISHPDAVANLIEKAASAD